MERCPPQLALLAALSGFVAGCQQTVALGAECPSFHTRCEQGEAGDGDSSQDENPSDGGTPARADASFEPSASNDEPVFGMRNPSFELTRGSGGEISKLGKSEIEPWYTCRDGLVASSEADLPGSDQKGAVRPQDGNTLVSLSFPLGVALGAGLFQQLERPLAAGKRVAFVIDVRSVTRDDDRLSLVVWGANTACLAQEELAASRTVADDEGWVSLCISFVPRRDFAQIGLEARSSQVLGEGSRLMIDHIRTSPDCK